MPKKTRSAEEIDKVRGQILDCAFDILVTQGYEGLSMAKIGADMNMTAANLYNYYANKDELLIAIHKKAFGMLYNVLYDAAKNENSQMARLRILTNAFVKFGVENINIYDIMFNRRIRQHSDFIGTSLEALSSDEFQSSHKTFLFAIKTIEEYRNSRKDLSPNNPQLLAMKYFSILHGIVSLHNSGILSQIDESPTSTMQQVIDFAISSVTEAETEKTKAFEKIV